MKIIKRNGSEVQFDNAKIYSAVSKANEAVEPIHRISPDDVQKVTDNVTKKCEAFARTPEVEEVQDMVERELMALGAFTLAKTYITYRYTRELVRKSNTTDERIMSLIECVNEDLKNENSNKNPTVNSIQRDYMAGEVSKDLTRRILLPPDIVKAHEEGLIHFHDADYFAQHMHNCDLVNLKDMLENGTVISGTKIDPPKSFSTACNIAAQIIAQVASNQYGGQSISLTHLAPFVDISRRKIRRAVSEELSAAGITPSEEQVERITEMRLKEEINRGVQCIQYQVVTLLTTNGQAPLSPCLCILPRRRTREPKPTLRLSSRRCLSRGYRVLKTRRVCG